MNEAIKKLRDLHTPSPKPLRLPTEEEVVEMEKDLKLKFHPDFKRYLLEASDVCTGYLKPVSITSEVPHQFLPEVVKSSRNWGVPEELIPICEDNSNFYCIDENGKIIFWSHDGAKPTGEEWENLATWIKEVWIGEGQSSDESEKNKKMKKAYKNCQSCGMPMKKDPENGGTNADGSKSLMYCSFCYASGEFLSLEVDTPEKMQKFCIEKMIEMKIPKFLAWIFTRSIPKLERWKNGKK